MRRNNHKYYVSMKEAADMLMLSTGTVRRLITRGDLVAYKFGKKIRITKDSLQSYIANQKISVMSEINE